MRVKAIARMSPGFLPEGTRDIGPFCGAAIGPAAGERLEPVTAAAGPARAAGERPGPVAVDSEVLAVAVRFLPAAAFAGGAGCGGIRLVRVGGSVFPAARVAVGTPPSSTAWPLPVVDCQPLSGE